MNLVETVKTLRAELASVRRQDRRIALVPTMGNLHAGHLALIDRARQEADFVVASIFVNPLQFGPSEDLDNYPRTLAADRQKLQDGGCDMLFLPGVEGMYPGGMQQQTLVLVPDVSEGLCGASRPGHFAGVATVVNKLFNMVQPDIAVFGEKDYQQLAVIRKMTADLNLPIRVLGQPTVRADDQLALSSRNGYLNEEQRRRAPALYQQLQQIGRRLQAGERNQALVLADGRQALEDRGLRVDYLEIREADSLRPADPAARRLIVLGAVYLGSTRLIDNLRIELN